MLHGQPCDFWSSQWTKDKLLYVEGAHTQMPHFIAVAEPCKRKLNAVRICRVVLVDLLRVDAGRADVVMVDAVRPSGFDVV